MIAVTALYHQDPSGWWADAPAVPGWSATAATLDDLRPLVEEGVRFALESDEVIVTHMLAPGLTAHGLQFDFIDNRVTVIGAPVESPDAEPALEFAATG